MIRSNPPLIVATATLVVSPDVHDNRTTLLDRSAGVTVTLPKATGSGKKYRFVVKTASNANVIESETAAAFFVGGVLIGDGGDSPSTTVDLYEADGTTHDHINPTTAGGGGLIGDWIEIEDIATNLYRVAGVFRAVSDPATPFATS